MWLPCASSVNSGGGKHSVPPTPELHVQSVDFGAPQISAPERRLYGYALPRSTYRAFGLIELRGHDVHLDIQTLHSSHSVEAGRIRYASEGHLHLARKLGIVRPL